MLDESGFVSPFVSAGMLVAGLPLLAGGRGGGKEGEHDLLQSVY